MSSEPNTTKIAELDDLDDVVGAVLEVAAEVGPADAEHDRADVHGDEAVAVRRDRRDAVGGEGDAERVERLLMGRDRLVEPPPRGSSTDARSPIAMPKARPSADVLQHEGHQTKSLLVELSAAVSASTGGSARPSLSPDSRFSEWRTRRGTRGLVTTLDDEHRVGGRQQRAEQERLVQTGRSGRGGDRDDRGGDRHRDDELCAAAAATRAGASRPRPRGRRGTGSRSARRSRAATTKPDSRVEVEDLQAASPSAKPASTNSAVSDRKLRWARPESSAPTTSSAPKTRAPSPSASAG